MKKITYEQFVRDFDPESLVNQFSGDFETGINACVELCDRHINENCPALCYQDKDGNTVEYSYQELMDRSAQFANYLIQQGIGSGDSVACLLPRTPELVITLLGVLRAGAVYLPLFTAFGSGAIEYRLKLSGAKLIVTNEKQRPKLSEITDVPKVLLVSDRGSKVAGQSDSSFYTSLDSQSTFFKPVLIGGNELILQMFTSGTTGKSKGVGVPAKSLLVKWLYMTYAVGLKPSDKYWNTADPGWAFGLFWGVIGTLLLGSTVHFNEQMFTAENTFDFIRKYKITHFAAAPTAYRMLMASEEILNKSPLSLRSASCAGEPLNPEINNWVKKRFDCQINDHYGTTEVGMVSANYCELNHSRQDSCMGYALPGYRLVVLNDDFEEVLTGESGQLAIDIDKSPLYYFGGYTWGEKSAIYKNYYLTGDVVRKNAGGSHSYTGRDDDIIASAGYRIGPADVESTLLEHPAILESGVIGKPDETRGEIVKAYIVLLPSFGPSDELAEEIQQFVRQRLSTHSFPREVSFMTDLPKTPSGKIQRHLLRDLAVEENNI